MRQLQLFTTAELAAMRDRRASRRYSPEAEEFRRDHARHRKWGLAQRHARRLRRLHPDPRDVPAPDATEDYRSGRLDNARPKPTGAEQPGFESEPDPEQLTRGERFQGPPLMRARIDTNSPRRHVNPNENLHESARPAFLPVPENNAQNAPRRAPAPRPAASGSTRDSRAKWR
jgi:hypothetical protein